MWTLRAKQRSSRKPISLLLVAQLIFQLIVPAVAVANVPPVADAGPDRTVEEDILVALEGKDNGAVTINNDAKYANSTAVTLNLAAADPEGSPISMRFKNDGGAWSGWGSFASSKSWQLPAIQGTRKVWAQFKDVAGNLSEPISDTIFLDTTAPQRQKITAPRLLSNVTSGRTIRAAWSATDT